LPRLKVLNDVFDFTLHGRQAISKTPNQSIAMPAQNPARFLAFVAVIKNQIFLA